MKSMKICYFFVSLLWSWIPFLIVVECSIKSQIVVNCHNWFIDYYNSLYSLYLPHQISSSQIFAKFFSSSTNLLSSTTTHHHWRLQTRAQIVITHDQHNSTTTHLSILKALPTRLSILLFKGSWIFSRLATNYGHIL